MLFKDHFSQQAAGYVKYRPVYPAELFAFLANLPDEKEIAWDCGAGNGQAATGLAPYFRNVLASDASKNQVIHAIRHNKVHFCLMPGENAAIHSRQVDLLVVSQAVHWFQFARFYSEAKRVLKSNGIIAIWSYGLPRINRKMNRIVDHLYSEILGSYWPPERKFIDLQYKTIPFPFSEIPAPRFKMRTTWDFNHFIGYLNTWSAVQNFKMKHKMNPVGQIEEKLSECWGIEDKEYSLYWPLYLRVGKKQDNFFS